MKGKCDQINHVPNLPPTKNKIYTKRATILRQHHQRNTFSFPLPLPLAEVLAIIKAKNMRHLFLLLAALATPICWFFI